MKKKRIVITGMGIVSCFGNDVDTFYQSLLAGKSGITPITEFPCEDYPTRFAGSILMGITKQRRLGTTFHWQTSFSQILGLSVRTTSSAPGTRISRT